MSGLLAVKKHLAPWIHRVGYYSGAAALGRRGGGSRIIMLHGVGVPGMTLEQFQTLMEFLSRAFRVISLPDLLRRLENGSASPGNDVVLTFDDGLRNNFTAAYPVLRALRLPATFYVCPGLVEKREWLWNHEARARLQSLPPDERRALAAGWGQAGEDPDPLVEWIKGLGQERQEPVLRAIREATTAFRPTAEQHRQFEMMTWEDLRSMDRDLITIGSHTVNHAILTGLAPAELEYQVGEGREWLERVLDRPVRHFCYPNGLFDRSVRELVEKNFDSATSVNQGFVGRGADRYALKRIAATRHLPAMAWALASWSARG